ncbi:hypothetical protein Rhopal_000058-T1 [Rhodotorula paludigena]|uniref:Uncharacterized protein n=1 Tax=Rhodotorula paludigena TaxID=86838 RepID=A0AAV5GEP2_9BASI|nr:hypothetical protein Rhopal_000058-T1 [Rhodotorula paludigena]
MCLLAGRCISDKRIPGGYFCQNGIASACGDGVKFCDRQTGAPTTCAAGYLKPPTGQNKCVKGTSDMFYDFLDDVYVKDCAKAATYRCDDTRCYTLTLAKHLDVYSNMCTPCQDGAHLTCDIDGFATSCLPDWHLVPYANSNSLGQDAYSFEGQGKKACIRCNGDRVWDEAQQKCTLTCAEGFRPHIGVTDYCGSCSGEGAICPAGESWMTCGIEGSNRNFYLDVPSRTCKEQIFS